MRPVCPALMLSFLLLAPFTLSAQNLTDPPENQKRLTGSILPEPAAPLTEPVAPMMDILIDLPPSVTPAPDPAAAPLPEVQPSSDGNFPAGNTSAVPAKLVKSARPVIDEADLARLQNIMKNNDPNGRLVWVVNDTAYGDGIEADAAGRLVGLNLIDKNLSGVLSFNGSEHMAEIKSRGDQFTGFKLSALPELRILHITGSPLTALQQNNFMSLPNLTWLELPENQIEAIEQRAFSALKSLEALHLSGNRLTTLQRFTFAGLGQLTELFLDKNQLKTLEPGLFEPLSQLTTLNLSANALTRINDDNLAGLTNLEVCHLDNNRISAITTGAFRDLTILKYLNLNDNHLTAINPKVLAPLVELAELDLTGNRLPLGEIWQITESVPETTLVGLSNQKDVYFGLRLQLLPQLDTFEVPIVDAMINGTASQGEIFGDDPESAVYQPSPGDDTPGRLVFNKSGVYSLLLSNTEISPDPEINSVTGFFLVIDKPLSKESVLKITNGDQKQATAFMQTMSNQGYIEISPDDTRMADALKDMFPDLATATRMLDGIAPFIQ